MFWLNIAYNRPKRPHKKLDLLDILDSQESNRLQNIITLSHWPSAISAPWVWQLRHAVGQRRSHRRPAVGRRWSHRRPAVGRRWSHRRPAVGRRRSHRRPAVGRRRSHRRPAVGRRRSRGASRLRWCADGVHAVARRLSLRHTSPNAPHWARRFIQ